jgi:biopolymer transport protein ExbD
MNAKWILIKDCHSFEPVSLRTLRTWVYEGRLNEKDLVSSDGGKTWTPAANTPELVAFFPSQTASISEIPRGYSGKVERKRRSIEIIDMVPMIDMVFLLLIFFAVTSNFEMQRVMKMNTPEASSGEIMERSRTLTVTVNELNQFFFDGQPIEFNGYQTLLKEAVQDGDKLILVIKGDEQAKHGNVIRLMDMAKSVGVEKIMITVKKKGR